MSDIERVLEVLDCPDCMRGAGLVGQRAEDAVFLACPDCEFWFPIRQEVLVLLPAARIHGGFRRALGRPVLPELRLRPPGRLDMKVLIYSYAARMAELCRAFDVHRQPLVVDIGCSTGSFCSALREEQTYFGLDVSFTSLAFARRATGQLFAQADAQRLPIKTRGLSFFVSREVLEHLADPAAGARELRRVAQSGLVETPNLDFPLLYDPINYVLTRMGRRARYGIYGYDHQRLFDAAGWRDLLTSSGFEVQREAPIGTGLALNAGDNLWHALLSWRSFDSLPRAGVTASRARALSQIYAAAHRVDKTLYPFACSQAYLLS
jgi:SAM-dependent methyltransferase